VSDQLAQCVVTKRVRRCESMPLDPAAAVPMCGKHLLDVIDDLAARGVHIEMPAKATAPDRGRVAA
jgi:hypothetical protein